MTDIDISRLIILEVQARGIYPLGDDKLAELKQLRTEFTRHCEEHPLEEAIERCNTILASEMGR